MANITEVIYGQIRSLEVKMFVSDPEFAKSQGIHRQYSKIIYSNKESNKSDCKRNRLFYFHQNFRLGFLRSRDFLGKMGVSGFVMNIWVIKAVNHPNPELTQLEIADSLKMRM